MRQLLTFLAVLVLASAGFALAQTPVGIYGYDTGTNPDGGVIRKVQVDSQGRLVTSGSAGVSTDAGVTVTVPHCTASQSRATSVGVTVTAVPAVALAGRWMVRVCNSARNTGTPIVTCTSDGTTPTTASSSNGEALEVGDCATYTTSPSILGVGVICISDTAATYVTSEECK